MKQPRKVSLINVRDCPRVDFDAYWQISVLGNEVDGFHWRARLLSYKPIGYAFEGKVLSLAEAAQRWPEGMPKPTYPSDEHLARQAAYADMSPEEKRAERVRQEEFRQACAKAHASAPQPVHLIEEALDVEPTRDEADTVAQEWVREKMKEHRKRKPTQVAGYAIPLPLDPVSDLVRDLYDVARHAWRKYARPLLMALAYNTTIRNNMLTQIVNAIDGGAGAGLWRIYDGARPATCGAATTLGAELTCSDPCGTVGSQVLTFSAITADASANASITASWSRLVDSTGTCCVDGNVGTSGSDLNLNSTTITAGQEVAITSATITEGNP